MHIDRFCVDCVEELEEKLEKALSTLDYIAYGEYKGSPRKIAVAKLEELGFKQPNGDQAGLL
jgi:hypothetical protein